jgi:signal transduction histidine kinase
LHGNGTVAEALAGYVSSHELPVGTERKVVSLDDGTYTISLLADPVEEGKSLLIYADVTSIMAFTNRVNIILLAVILTAVLISVLLSRRFARSFSRPVQELSDFAADVGSGRLEQRELDFRDQELRQLADSMNRMVEELDQAKQKQETFFQNVSHELRTPLTSIRGNAEGILYGIIEPKAAGKVILSESDKLGGMVEDILYLSRMGKGRPEGEAEPVDLREVLSLCVSEQHTEAEKKGLTFAFDFDEDPVLLAIRETDAERLFGNLISNAVRYASREIRLSCHTADGKITVRVADDGPGVAEEDLPHVFERFYKGKDGKHGIGLAIAKAAAEAWNGKLQAHNDGGAVFEAIFEKR